MTMSTDVHYQRLLLLRTPGISAQQLRQALAPEADLGAELERLRAGAGAASVEWLQRPDQARLAADLRWLDQAGHHLLVWGEADYPPQLSQLDEPPAALLRPQIAVVGSRAASAAGRRHARQFAQTLAQHGFVVTSGLAEGIDGEAHRAALEAGGSSIAVLGTGPDRIYPARHQTLAQQLRDAGAVVSELVPGTPPRGWHFPRRNRLIAGLSLATVVIEAGLQSGSLITARLAAEQGREVFAIPGSIEHPLARGCHRLIRDGARLVEDPAEIVAAMTAAAAAMGPVLQARLATANAAAVETLANPQPHRPDPEYVDLLDALGHDPTPLDTLVERTGQPVAALSSMLLMLELEGLVESLGGARYQRLDE